MAKVFARKREAEAEEERKAKATAVTKPFPAVSATSEHAATAVEQITGKIKASRRTGLV